MYRTPVARVIINLLSRSALYWSLTLAGAAPSDNGWFGRDDGCGMRVLPLTLAVLLLVLRPVGYVGLRRHRSTLARR
jgi:hypothetical protein